MIGFGAGMVAPTVYAEWTPGENQRLFEHVARIAEALHNANIWGEKLSDIAVDEDITNSINWIDEPPWVRQEVLDMKDVIDDFDIFLHGGSVLADSNRAAAVNSMLLGLN